MELRNHISNAASVIMDSRTTTVPCLSDSDSESECFDTPLQLESPWTFWFDAYPGPGLTADQYAAAMKKLGSTATVQVRITL